VKAAMQHACGSCTREEECHARWQGVSRLRWSVAVVIPAPSLDVAFKFVAQSRSAVTNRRAKNLHEADELLTEIEAALTLDGRNTSETIHHIFPALHAIKGASGMFGLTAVTNYAHQVETLLDRVRSESWHCESVP